MVHTCTIAGIGHQEEEELQPKKTATRSVADSSLSTSLHTTWQAVVEENFRQHGKVNLANEG